MEGKVDEGDRQIKASVRLRVRERSIMRLSSVYIKKWPALGNGRCGVPLFDSRPEIGKWSVSV